MVQENDFRSASLEHWSTVAPDWGELAEAVDRQLKPATDWMLDAVALRSGERVLDLAGGPGTMSLHAARAVGPDGHVIHSDFAEAMVTAARARFESTGVANVESRVIDAESIDLPDCSVDVALCRMGYMLMADPGAALRETARVLAPGGRMALAVWASPGANPWIVCLMGEIMGHLGAPPPPPDAPGGLWSLADEARLYGLLEAAGLGSIRIEALDGAAEFESFGSWWETTRRLAGPLRQIVANLDDEALSAILARVRQRFASYEQPGGSLAIPNRMVVAAAQHG